MREDPEGRDAGYDDLGYEDQPEMREEMNYRERVDWGILGDRDSKNDPKELFKMKVFAVSRDLTSGGTISDDDVRDITSFYPKMKNPHHKNVAALVLGYVASYGGKKLEGARAKRVFSDLLPEVRDKTVAREDVVRYARYWIVLKGREDI